jgi:putative PEP-CTERM system histidine kinase
MYETSLSVTSFFLFLALSALVMLKKRSSLNLSFCVAVFLLALIEAAGRLSLEMPYEPSLFKASLFFESLLPVTLLSFSLAYSRQKISLPWGALLMGASVFTACVFLFPLGEFFYSPDIETEKMLFLGQKGYWFYLGIMVCCIISLVNIEAAFRASSGTGRWKMKFEAAGIIAILAVLILYYSYGLLYRSINMSMIPVKSGVMIMAALLIAYSRIFRGNDERVVVSRHVLYRSLSMLLVGLYLVALWMLGEGMRYLEVSFGENLMMLAAFIGGIAIFLVLFSGQMRRKAKVYISKHFYAHKYDYRSEWLKFTERLSSCRTIADVQYVVVSTFKETFGLEGVSLYLLDRDERKYVLAYRYAMADDVSELKASRDLISYLKDRGRVFNPLDGEYEPTAEESFFVRQSGARFIVPLICNGEVEGLMVFGKQLVREDFIYEDFDLMKNIAKQAALSIVNISLYEELAEAREMSAVARISSFVIHDLKNLASSLSVLLDNAEDYIGVPEFQNDMLETIRNTSKQMKDLIQKLRAIPEKQVLKKEVVDLDALVGGTVSSLERAGSGVELLYKGASSVSMADAEEIRNVVLNLLLNAIDAANGNGLIKVETGCNGDKVYIRVEDRGCGMSQEFMRDNMFRPFRTTKKKGLGIGLYQCKQIVEAHGGRIGVSSKVGEGAVFTVQLPAAVSPART